MVAWICSPLVDDFEVLPLEKGRHFGLPSQNGVGQLSRDLLLLLLRFRIKPFLKSNLSLTAEQYDEMDHCYLFLFVSLQ